MDTSWACKEGCGKQGRNVDVVITVLSIRVEYLWFFNDTEKHYDLTFVLSLDIFFSSYPKAWISSMIDECILQG